jgi:hypothetical protein
VSTANIDFNAVVSDRTALYLIERGATWDSVSFQWKDGEGNPVDLTGCAVEFIITETATSTTALKRLTNANGGVVVTPDQGLMRFVMSADETAEIGWEKAVYTLQITFPDGHVRRLARGRLTTSKERRVDG